MLHVHTKLSGYRSTGSEEVDLLMILPYMGMVAILVMRPGSCKYIFISMYPKE